RSRRSSVGMPDRSSIDRAVSGLARGPAAPTTQVRYVRQDVQTARSHRVSRASAKLLGRFGRLTVINRVERDRYPSPETPVRPSPERYVGRREMARIMGVSLATVDRLVAQGMPSVTWGRRTRRFRPSLAISWATSRERST